SISPDLDALIDEATRSAAAAAARRPSSAPPPAARATRATAARPASAPSMIALMDGYEMYGYQPELQQQQVLLQHQPSVGEAAAALRQPPQQTLESWFATAYNQPLQLEAATVMNAGAYGTMAPPTDAAGLAATVAESANFPNDVKNVQLFSEEHQQLFAASSSTAAEQQNQQQQQVFQNNAVKQEVLMDELGEDSSQRPSVFQTAPPTTSGIPFLMNGQAPAKRGRPTENPCWDNFERLDDTLVKCNTCDKVVKSACATNMTKHLERHHPEEHQALLHKIRLSRQYKVYGSISLQSSTDSIISRPFLFSAMALNHIAHQPQHHLLQPMVSDLGQQLGHHLPLSPDPSPAAPHCLLSAQHHFLKDPSSIRPEMLLIPTSDGLIPNMDPNSYHVPSDFYQMPFDNSLFDTASQWQQRHFAPVSSGYDQWMGDQSDVEAWNQQQAAAATLAVQQQQQLQLEQLQLQQNSVIQSAIVASSA
ncbi:hypothetical protein PFISCL1PPCAC_16118, partial [Pristionchus fissidentatus]